MSSSLHDSNAIAPDSETQSSTIFFAGKLLIFGVAITALIATPGQLVFPDTIKSITASIISIIALLLLSWEYKKTLKFRWSFFLIFPLVIATVAVSSVFWGTKYAALVEAGRWLMIFLVILAGINSLKKTAFHEFSSIVHWCIFLLSVVALFQFWLDLSWFPAAAAPGSTFGNRNFFAEFVAAGIPFSFWVLIRKQSFVSALWRSISMGIILLALMSTGARAALIATLAGIGAMAIIYSANRHRAALFTTGPALAVSLFMPIVLIGALGWIPSLNESILDEHRGNTAIERTINRLGSLTKDATYEDGSSFGIRIVAWEASVKMIQENPFIGVGAGAWNANLPVYTPQIYDTDIEYVWLAHNEPLQFIAEFGAIAWIALLGLLYLVASAAGQAFIKMRRSDTADISEGTHQGILVLSITLMGITSLSGLPLHAPAANYLLAITIAMLLIFRGTELSISSTKTIKHLPVLASIAALMVSCVISVQALRADSIFLRGYNILAAVAKHPNPDKVQASQLRNEALNYLKTSFAIYPDQGNFTGGAANYLGAMGDHESVIWINDLMLNLRPNTTALRCNKVIAHVETQNYKAAIEEVEIIKNSRPNSSCLEFSEFILSYKTGDYKNALPIGLKILDSSKKSKNDEKLRFIIESTYRSATRMSDLPAAIRMLKLRGDKWPDLRPHSRLLEGLLLANIASNQMSPEATAVFQDALSSARPAERTEILRRIPEAYQKILKN